MGESADPLEQLILARRANGRRKAGVSAELGPGPLAAAQDVRQLDAGLMHEGREVEVAVRAQLRGHRLPAVGDLRAQVLEDQRLGLSIHDDLAAGRQEREPSFDLALEAPTSLAGQRAQLLVEAKLLALVSDEVEDGQHGLVGRAAKSATELLQEDRGALGGAEEQHRVDVGQVEALVEQVGGEEDVDSARLEVLKCALAVCRGCVTTDR